MSKPSASTALSSDNRAKRSRADSASASAASASWARSPWLRMARSSISVITEVASSSRRFSSSFVQIRGWVSMTQKVPMASPSEAKRGTLA